jgi:hypothetical protein
MVFFISPAFSVPLESLVSSVRAEQLRSGNEPILEVQLRNPSPALMPQNNELRQFVNTAMRSLNPGMMVETLYLYRKPVNYHTSANIWDERQKIALFNQLLTISTLAGTQYFSSSRGEMRTFYESSFIVDGPSSRNPLADPVFAELPPALTFYARQKDLTFGDNVYRYDFQHTSDVIIFSQINITAMNFGIIPGIGRNNLKSIIAIFDCGDTILIYAVSMARAASVPGMGDRVGNSFRNRAVAVLNWLAGRLDNHLYIQ